MKHLNKIAVAATAGLLLAACADTDDLGPGSDPDPAEQEDAEDLGEAEEEAAEEDAPDELEVDEDEQAEGLLRQEFDEPIVYEDGGVRVSITGIGITSMDSPEVDDELREWVEDGVETIVGLEMTVSNDSGEVINIYVNQGEIQVGREQVEADMLLSDHFAGGDMRDGVDDDGLVVWGLSSSYDDVVAEGTLDYVASAPTSAETWDELAGPIELTVEWEIE